MKTLIPSLEDYIQLSVMLQYNCRSQLCCTVCGAIYLYDKNLFGARCVVFRLGIIGMMKRILGNMIRIKGKNFENTRIE